MTLVTPETPLETLLSKKWGDLYKKKFGVTTVRDLIEMTPRRYYTRGELTLINHLPLGEEVTVLAEIKSVQERGMKTKRGSVIEATITDGAGEMRLTWFNQKWRVRELVPGRRGLFSGKPGLFQGTMQLAHPEYKLFPETGMIENPDAWARKPVPVYAATAQLPSWKIADHIRETMTKLDGMPDPFTREMLTPGTVEKPYAGLWYAFEAVHNPESEAHWRWGLKSLKYREALELQLGLLTLKHFRATLKTKTWTRTSDILKEFDAALPYTLTGDQREVGDTIAKSLESDMPMHRLLQGEVGSGKTLVALRAMLQIAGAGGQSALLAPTEVLASQHLRSITELLGPGLTKRLKPTLLTGQLPAAAKKQALKDIASGEAKIVVGTHALMSEATTFSDLGFVVIDEQHRFGVEQREALRRKAGTPPHTLVMTATPIPRTVALTVFGDLEISTLREMPAGRAQILSHVVPTGEHPAWLQRVWQRAAEEIVAGRQVYVVCPAIAPGEAEDGFEVEADLADLADLTDPANQEGQGEERTLANVAETLAGIRRHETLGSVTSAGLTGQMGADEKERVMVAFAEGKIDILVATTVIEVGVNVPNASVMIVLDADRFGISQLHQLRGRVGRGEHPGLALFVTGAEAGSLARERVDAVSQTLDGFQLAQADLELRREGDVLGSSQAGGKSQLKWLRVVRDASLIDAARRKAEEILAADPHLRHAPELQKKLVARYLSGQVLNLERS